VSDISCTVYEEGGFAQISKWLTVIAMDNMKAETVDKLARQAAETIDLRMTTELKYATNIIYASADGVRATDANQITLDHKLTTTEIRMAVRDLKKRKARPFIRNGKRYFKLILGPDAEFDLMDDTKWEAISTYQQAEKIEDGEIGRIFGALVIVAGTDIVWTNAGYGGTVEVYGSIMFGEDAYGSVAIAPDGNLQFIVQDFGSSGSADPFKRRATLSWYMCGFGVKIIDNSQLVMIKHGVSA
jgi:N4-gp56 family major capsid protein